MGTKINELVSESKKVISFENLLNKDIAIDAFNTIYHFLAIIRQKDGTPLKDYNGNVTSHLSGLFYRTLNFLEHNIKNKGFFMFSSFFSFFLICLNLRSPDMKIQKRVMLTNKMTNPVIKKAIHILSSLGSTSL